MNLVMIRPSRNNLEGPICELFFPPHKTISFPRYVSTIVVRILGGGITVHHHGIRLVIGIVSITLKNIGISLKVSLFGKEPCQLFVLYLKNHIFDSNLRVEIIFDQVTERLIGRFSGKILFYRAQYYRQKYCKNWKRCRCLITNNPSET